MGEEWAEPSPFLYFVDHGDPDLNAAVREGRAEEFSGFFDGAAYGVPDPSAEETFDASVLHWSLIDDEDHENVVECYRRLIRVRRDHDAIGRGDPDAHQVERRGTVIFVDSTGTGERCVARFNASHDAASAQLPPGDWALVLDAGDVGAEESSAGSRLPGWGFSVHRERSAA
jgi:maltooligosyltrehalose trehalohydrolase